MVDRDPMKIALIPAHVPHHWTLVAVFVKERTIRFFDSLPNRSGREEDEAGVREPLERILDLVWTNTKLGPPPRWKWISEKRASRQRNSYDCGAFTLADMASYIRSGQPSSWGQDEMVSWRAVILNLLDKSKHITYIPTPDGPADESNRIIVE
ncbi:hypothetical protein M422DRAFT_257460 [Sphaerobolus stellatus SS14]|uniref:Ubiquitin-like protease family profile domain-containing protein n=1 Tax=Sphaerobolus stellatus (strain SS14) TaxID=990650 RepID=A0A0C9VDZ2_SPHS4|nr:hypothetical protein M422DRAFT_257460 [Sphaerobolus stellatus SS14]